ncbi:septum formation protein Maf [Erythrobacter sp. KY5]|uniref:Maf family protein n=1 Tax=Erythrobacter sp. KY5 TaxID=2011159 RepID=UPI000DBF035D|nr:Maf family nucleotide pyrophosphatase [Erythrobacter sp. KY5]AWW73214.1 septum formation protein Maf [Erythrobacter sp. KY5]
MKPPELVLASKSASRRAMLDAAGVPYRAVPAELDERAIEAGLLDASAPEIAEALSVAKAAALAPDFPDAIVLGSDSLVVVDGERFDKPTSRENAAEHLRFFSGKVLELHSAAALVRKATCEWSYADCARLAVRDLSDDFIEHYLRQEWPEVGYTVGCFRIEAMGVQLFESIEGDQFTVLGMPLLAVLEALREHGVLMS